MSRKYGALTSSQNPEEVANKVKGVILASSSIIIFLAARFLGITLTANDVISLATQLSAVAGSVWMIYGFALNAIAWFYARKNA